jgi:Zn-dependent peptidase ImmA (M78 family)
VTVHDYRVLMQVMQTVAHELAHLLFLTEDNSKEHSDAESQIYKEIVRLF